jgi:hypothetical protein
MKFTVDWLPTAERALASIWNSAQDQQAIANSSDTIDLLLGNDPQKKATPVDQFYFFRVDPLVVLLDINLADRTVQVIEVHLADQ